MDNRPFRGIEHHAQTVRDTVIGPEEGGRHRPEGELGIGINAVKPGIPEQPVLLQLSLDQAKRQARGIEREIHLLEQIRNTADMVFMPVGDNQGPHLILIIQQVGNIGNDQVNTQQALIRKFRPAADSDNIITVLQDIHILANLMDAAQGGNL